MNSLITKSQEHKISLQREPIAIIGIGCRFPGAENVGEFWHLLKNSVDAIEEVPPSRWDSKSFYDPDINKPGKMNTRWGGFLKDVDLFDPYFFGILPREATRMDPQQRILLEVVWQALEDAGQVRENLAGSKTGIFIGMMTSDYGLLQLSEPDSCDAFTPTGIVRCVSPNRVSHIFDFRGPSLAIDTACSSSLVATHLACQSIWTGESSLAIAGGVSLMLSPAFTISCARVGLLSPDGRCKAFDSGANGYVRSEGCGVVILKSLSKALADNDPIYAVIRGSAVGQDGATTTFKTPSQKTQERVMLDACEHAGIFPKEIQYVEAHGTGTIVGDPIEAMALNNVLSIDRAFGNYCSIGSVKTNLGHMESAAGIAGLIKAALAIKHQLIPENIHFKKPNPNINFSKTCLKVQTQLGEWPSPNKELIAGVNSFGLSGTNAHVILSSLPDTDLAKTPSVVATHQTFLLPISAHSQEALENLAKDYQDFLFKDISLLDLTDICYTASVRRSHQDYRLAVVGQSANELAEHLKAFINKEARLNMSSARKQSGPNKLVFIFPGIGSQWFGMAKDLIEKEPTFERAMEKCDQEIQKELGWSVLSLLYAENEIESRFTEIDIIQPIIFSIQVSLATLWRSWGIEPDAVIGQSMGETALAYVVGALTLEEAVQVICRRSILLKKIKGKGAMVVAELSYEEAQNALKGYEDRVSVAICNSPKLTVLAGEPKAVQEIMYSLLRQYVFCRKINSEVATHSPETEHLCVELVEQLKELKPKPSNIPVYSTLTADLIEGEQFTADYWANTLRQPVLFSQAIEKLLKQGYNIFLELSPDPILLAALQQGFAQYPTVLLPSMRKQKDSISTMLGSLGTLYTIGYPIDLAKFYKNGKVVSLPQYPWQKERFWLSASSKSIKEENITPIQTNGLSPEAINLFNDFGNVLIRLLSYFGGNLTKEIPALSQILSQELPNKSNITELKSKLESKASTLSTTTIEDSSSPIIDYTQQSIENYLKEQIAKLAGFSPNKLDIYQPINRMGLDSLLALSLKNRVEADLKVKLPVASFFQGANISQIATQLLEQLKSSLEIVKIETTVATTPVNNEDNLPTDNAITSDVKLIENYLRQQIAEVAGFSPSRLDVYQPINRIGLDSILALELKKQIETQLSVELPVASFFKGANIVEVSQELFDQVRQKDLATNSLKSYNKWIICEQPKPNAKIRLFCIPFAGIGASVFCDWQKILPSEIEVCAIELPGRETRFKETLHTNLNNLIPEVATAIEPYLNLPFALFGHSVGGLIAFELARYLRNKMHKQPIHLFVSAYLDPKTPVFDQAIDELEESSFLEKMRIFGAKPETLIENSELKEIYLPILRADSSLFCKYQYLQQEPFSFPITIFGGLKDPKMTQETLVGWQNQTTNTFNLHMLEGDHFFIQNLECCQILLKIIQTQLINH